MSINRIIVLLTPVFVGISGWICQWVADHFPGAPALDQGELTAVFVAGALAGVTVVAQWLHGWQKHEARQAAADEYADAIAGGVEEIPEKPDSL